MRHALIAVGLFLLGLTAFTQQHADPHRFVHRIGQDRGGPIHVTGAFDASFVAPVGEHVALAAVANTLSLICSESIGPARPALR